MKRLVTSAPVVILLVLAAQFHESARLEASIKENLARLGYPVKEEPQAEEPQRHRGTEPDGL